MTWDSSTSTRGSAGLVGGRTVTVSTLEVTARGALRGGGSGCHRDGGGHSMGTAGRPHSPGRGQDEPQRAVQHGPDDEVGRLVQLCRERGREGSGAETAPAHARGARVAQVHPASKHRHGQAHGAAPGMGARPRAPPARVLAPGAAEPRAGRMPPVCSHSHTHAPFQMCQPQTCPHAHPEPHAHTHTPPSAHNLFEVHAHTRVHSSRHAHPGTHTRGPGCVRHVTVPCTRTGGGEAQHLPGDEEFVLGAARPVLHAPAPLHGEVDVAGDGGDGLALDADHCRGTAGVSSRLPAPLLRPPVRPAAHPGCR